MINTIIEAVSAALYDEFGDGYEICMEEIEQGLKEPCFHINCLNPSNSRFPGKRYFRTNLLCIQYFPETRQKQRECNDVAHRMYDCLEYITLNGDEKPTMGTKMKYEIVDGVLNFFVNYNCFVCRVEQNTPMEELQASTNLKG